MLRRAEEMKLRQQTPFHPQGAPQHKPRRYAEVENQFPDKWEYLHNDAAHKSKTFKRDIDKEEKELLKENEQYTFQPNKNGKAKSPRKGERSFADFSPRRDLDIDMLNESFQINVNIGSERKVIVANLGSDPAKTAGLFIKQHGIDPKHHQTLTNLIIQQQRLIVEKSQ